MRLLADENIQAPTIEFLKRLGYDIKGVLDAGLKSAPDPEIFTAAQNDKRALLTYNVDFVDVRELSKHDHAGIIRLRISNQRVGYAHPIIEKALNKLKGTDLTNTLVTVSDHRTRIRTTRM